MLKGCVPWPDEFVRLYKEKGYWEDIPFSDHIDEWVTNYADRPAIAFQGHEVTYRQMDAHVTRLAYHLTKMGLKTYDRVMVQLLNGPELIYLVYACFKIGAIPIATLPAHRWSEISNIAQQAGARAHAIPAGSLKDFDFEEFADKIREEVPSVEFVLTAGQAPQRSGMVSINDIIEQDIDLDKARAELKAYRPDPMEPTIFQLSGGTTGTPKIIPRTHNDYYYNAKCCSDAQGFDGDTRVLIPAPMMHNLPMVCGTLPCHIKGGTVVTLSSLAPDTVLKAIEKNRVNTLGILPVLLRILEFPEKILQKYDISSVKLLIIAALPPLMDLFHCDAIQVFGMAEGIISWSRHDDPPEIKHQTQGRMVSEADEMKILDLVTGEELPAGEKGEMVCRGPYTIRGYYKAPDRNKEAFTPDGYYRSGDLVIVDEKGNMQWSGRIKDCIDRGAEKINAEEVEGHVVEFPKVDQVAVVGMPDKILGERICAFVVPMPGEIFTLDELSEFLLNERKIAKFKLPERLEFVDELPLTKVGKFEKKSLREKITAILISEGKYKPEKEEDQKPAKSVKETVERMAKIFDSKASQGVTEVFQLHITGEQAGDWYLAVKDGSCNLAASVHENPTLTLTMADADFIDLRNGETDGQALLMGGRLKAEGNLMAATLIPSLFPVS